MSRSSLATVAMGVSVLIPYLVGVTVDEIRAGETNLWPLGGAIVLAGLLQLAFSVARRLVAGRVSLGVEFDLRNRIYRHLQSLELAFFDEQQTGQLMSRSTVDLSGRALLPRLRADLHPAVVRHDRRGRGDHARRQPRRSRCSRSRRSRSSSGSAFRYGRLNRPASQEVQQRIAELTAEVEESISGIRLVKAFAREERQLARIRHATSRVFDQSMVSTRLRAFYTPFIGFLPQLGLALVLLRGRPPGDRRHDHGRRVRRFHRLRHSG